MPLQTGGTYSLLIKNSSNTTLVGPIDVDWQGSKINTLAEFRNEVNNGLNNPYYPYIKASILTGIFRIEIDYKYFLDNSLGDPNTFLFQITDGLTYFDLPFENGVYGYDPSSYPPGEVPCFTLGTQVPQPELIEPIYIYYDSENETPPYIYYTDEEEENVYIEGA